MLACACVYAHVTYTCVRTLCVGPATERARGHAVRVAQTPLLRAYGSASAHRSATLGLDIKGIEDFGSELELT